MFLRLDLLRAALNDKADLKVCGTRENTKKCPRIVRENGKAVSTCLKHKFKQSNFVFEQGEQTSAEGRPWAQTGTNVNVVPRAQRKGNDIRGRTTLSCTMGVRN